MSVVPTPPSIFKSAVFSALDSSIANVQSINIQDVTIDGLTTDSLTCESLASHTVTSDQLTSSSITCTNYSCSEMLCSSLSCTSATATALNATTASGTSMAVSSVSATNAQITSLTATTAGVTNATVTNLTGTSVSADDLTVSNLVVSGTTSFFGSEPAARQEVFGTSGQDILSALAALGLVKDFSATDYEFTDGRFDVDEVWDLSNLQVSSMSMSKAGDRLAVGCRFNEDVGAVFMFTKIEGSWSYQQKLVATGLTPGSWFGYSVSFSSDGLKLAVGAISFSGGVGGVWIFTRSGGTWTQTAGPFNSVVGDPEGTYGIGNRVCVTSDGRLFRSHFSQSAEPVLYFDYNGQTNDVNGTGRLAIDDQFGHAMSLSGDESMLIVGAPGHDSSLGSVWFFSVDGEVVTELASTVVPSDFGLVTLTSFGAAVALSYADTAVIGAPDYDNTGAVWVYKYVSSAWTQFGTKIIPVGAQAFGASVAVSNDGNIFAAGDDDKIFVYVKRAAGYSLFNSYSLSLIGAGPDLVMSGSGLTFATSEQSAGPDMSLVRALIYDHI